jgi:hypothetical protein
MTEEETRKTWEDEAALYSYDNGDPATGKKIIYGLDPRSNYGKTE